MMIKLGRMALSILLVLGVSLSAVPVLAQGPSQTAEITLDPTPAEVVSGEAFTVTLKINNVPEAGMAAYDFKIIFTPGVIEFAASKGDHEWPDPDYGSPFAFNVDNTAGHISFNDVFTDTPAPSGDITLAVLHGTATATESLATNLHFEKAVIKDPEGDAISATVADGEVKVFVAPVASFGWEYTDANSSGTLDAGELIQFTDTSTNLPTGWDWDFDDTSSSTDQNPTHAYTAIGTYNISLIVTNLAGSDTVVDTITVEPNSLAEVAVSPDPATVIVDGSTSFSAAGYDGFDNPISGISWDWEVTDPTAGSIDATTGEFTAGDTPATYTDVIKATGTYKGATVSGYATVEVITWLADIGMTKGLGDDDVALVGSRIVDIYDLSAGQSVVVPGGIAGYLAEVNYSGAQINILGVRGGDVPFDDAPTTNIDNTAGHTSFAAVQTTAEPQAPIVVAQMVVRLVGSTNEEAPLALSFSQITDGQGTLIPQDEPDYEVFRRGDAKADGEVDIADALFIAQYLVGARDLGQGEGLTHPVNAASVKHDDGGDIIDIADVLFICQYLVGLRDGHMNPIP